MSSRTLIAVPLVSVTPPLAEQVRAARVAGADLVELRVDRVGDIPAIEALLEQPHELPFIVTVRAPAEGGAWSGSEAERIAVIERLAQYQPAFVDVEYAAWQQSSDVRTRLARACAAAGSRLILSHHDLTSTPADLAAVCDRLAATPDSVIKAVFTARNATDACRVLVQLQRYATGRDTIALAMGEAGLVTRVLARKFGAFLTFAALHLGAESAPGQPTVQELRELFRWDAVDRDTPVYGVIGWPVAHSQSPTLHNAALTAAGRAGVFIPLPVEPNYAGFAAFMDCAAQETSLGFAGFSVTLPHKTHASRWLDEQGGPISPLARRCGAVNTLTRRADGMWQGDNTDGLGALAALRSIPRCAGDGLRGKTVAVLGAGGVARAIVAALLEQGCQVTVFNRSPVRAEQLAQDLHCPWRPWAARSEFAGDILINCTSVGLWPATDETPLSAAALRPETVVFDTVYRPAQTCLLRIAQERGCETVSGLAMFIGQAAAQFQLWHHVPPPLDAMERAVGCQSGDGPSSIVR